MGGQGLGEVLPPSEDQNTDENQDSGLKGTTDFQNSLASDQLSLWLENAPAFLTGSKEIYHEEYAITFDDLESFGVPSSLPLKQMNPGEIPCLEKGQSSGAKNMEASDSLEMQTKVAANLQEDGEKELSGGWKPQKRTRCAEAHNLNEREQIRRQKLKDKMKNLRELIPNCDKKDKSSTLDDAISYIKILQYQVQILSAGVGHFNFHSPSTMMQQVQFPSYVQTVPPRGGNTDEMEYGIGNGMGMSNMFPSLSFPRTQLGFFYPCLLPSTSTLGLIPRVSTPNHFVRDSRNLFASPYATSFPTSGSQSTKPRNTSPSSQGSKQED